MSNAFDGLRVGGMWGAKQITGTLGAGTGTLKATTVSGAIASAAPPGGRRGCARALPAARDDDVPSGKVL